MIAADVSPPEAELSVYRQNNGWIPAILILRP